MRGRVLLGGVITVNEIDDLRGSNLLEQGYQLVFNQDASLQFRGFEKKFDAVLTNPDPAGTQHS